MIIEPAKIKGMSWITLIALLLAMSTQTSQSAETQTPAPELHIEVDIVSSTSLPLEQGDTLIIEITITNTGEQTANGVRLDIDLPSGLSFRSAMWSTPFTMDLGDIYVSDSVNTSTPMITPDEPGIYSVPIEVSADNVETVETIVTITVEETPETTTLVETLTQQTTIVETTTELHRTTTSEIEQKTPIKTEKQTTPEVITVISTTTEGLESAVFIPGFAGIPTLIGLSILLLVLRKHRKQ